MDLPHGRHVPGPRPEPDLTQSFTDITPCSNDAAANVLRPEAATGYGVQLVLTGDPATVLSWRKV